FREQNPRHQRLDLIAALVELATELRSHRRRDVLTHEVAIDLCRDELAGDGLREDDADDVVAVERALLAEERLLTGVMLRGIELIREDVVGPAGERDRKSTR